MLLQGEQGQAKEAKENDTGSSHLGVWKGTVPNGWEKEGSSRECVGCGDPACSKAQS